MAGLDKILEQIRQESDASVSEKLAEANKTADDIRQKAKEAVKDECAQIEERGKRQAEEALSRAESAAALYKRKAILAEKQRIIAEVFDEALKQLTRTNQKITEQSIHTFISQLEVSDAVKAELMAITPQSYTGL